MNKYNLQVGDYFKYDGVVRKVAMMALEYITFEVDHDSDGSRYTIVKLDDELIEPITIDDMWLELNGFVSETLFDTDDYSYVEWKCPKGPNRYLTFSNLSNSHINGYDVQIDNERYEGIACVDVEYVHHVQHVCADRNHPFKPVFPGI